MMLLRIQLIISLFQPGLPRREHEDFDGGLPLAGRQQLRRDPEHLALRQSCQKHQEQAEDQRGSEGRHAQGVPRGDPETKRTS